MYEALKKEIATYEQRTPRSAAALKKAGQRLPLGVASNFRTYEPHPLFVAEGKGGHIRDFDGNDLIDYNLCFGALLAGHCHPAVVHAVSQQLTRGTMYGMPHEMEYELAEEICRRFPVEQVRFANSGTEATMHAIRLARGFTGREKIIKMEGCYHGVHDSVLVSVKPKADKWGDPSRPTPVPASGGVPAGALAATLVAPFNHLEAVKHLFAEYPGQIACVILEPIMMNVGICMPDEGYLQGLRDLCTTHDALLIFDEVKTGAKLARGGACEYFGVRPDIVCLAKSIGGGFPLAAFAARRDIMDSIAQGKVFHAGTYNTNPVVMAAGLATFRDVLTPENYRHVNQLNQKLCAGYGQIVKENDITGYVAAAGANGALMFYAQPVRNYREWTEVDVDLWMHYWFAMVNRGVLAQPYWWDEQWTISVQHTEADIDQHLEAFAEVAPALATAQRERMATAAH
jgi:glutamate-1-semialdehyde 2,1-aminomutase